MNCKNAHISLFLLIILISLSTSTKESSHAPCSQNSDCLGNHVCRDEVCVHRGFFPPNFSQIIEIILMCGLSAVATAAGVGGGAIYSALLMFVENFEAQTAFPISSFSILICSLTTFYLGVKKKMKNPQMKFIDYDLVIVFCPALLLGSKIGVILNEIFPALILIIFLILSLSLSCYKTYKNALKAQNREKQKVEDDLLEKESSLIHSDPLEMIDVVANDFPRYGNNLKIQEESIDIFKGSSAPVRLDRVKWIILLQACMLLDNLIEGSKKLGSIVNIEKCSKYFWGVFFLFIFFCLGFTKLFYKRVKDEAPPKHYLQNDNLKVEFDITSPEVEKKISKIVFFCFLAGVVSGMLGIGGGIFMAPLMLELGIDPKVATSTSNFFLIFTSFSSTCLYSMAGNTVISYALLFGILCGIFSLFGSNYLTDYVEKTKKHSILIWTLFGVSVISLVILPINAIRHALYDLGNGKNIFMLGKYC